MAIAHRQWKGNSISILGVGGYSIGDVEDEKDAIRIVHECINAGVNFMDNAWEYHDGVSEERMGKALRGKRDGVFLMTKVCTHGRGKDVALQQLDESLRRLGTDHLDLWQVHEVIYWDDPDRHFASGGVIEALDEAKRSGKVRYVGFTGHKDPGIHLKMLERRYPFDTLQCPLNPFDANYRSFQHDVVTEARRQNIAVIGMKSMCGDGNPVKKKVATPEELLRYAMSLPVLTTVSGIDSLDVMRQNLAIAESFSPMSVEERQALERRLLGEATDGRFELFKSSKRWDADPGRAEHHFPLMDELAL
jgi:predicted aldo/keto reductase-like oxidoreductase